MEMPAVESTSEKPVHSGTNERTFYWRESCNLLCCPSIREYFFADVRLLGRPHLPAELWLITYFTIERDLIFSKRLLCLWRKYDLVNNNRVFLLYVSVSFFLSALDTIYIFDVSAKYVLGDRRRLLASSIVFFHSTLSVGCQYLGGLPYTVLEFGEGYTAFTLQ